MELYKYSALATDTSIRIIALQPDLSRDAPLRCKLISADRHATDRIPHHYEPVSYVWGRDPIFSQTLSCDCPENATRRIPITAEVENMLRSLRKPLRVIYLWIDAICLNQSDDAEKARQVPLMGDIYREGRKTHIFLASPYIAPNSFSQLSFAAVARPELLGQLEQHVRSEFSQILEPIMQDPWFTRRWVLQEALLSKNAVIRSRDDSMPWPLFIDSMHNVSLKVNTRMSFAPSDTQADPPPNDAVAIIARAIRTITTKPEKTRWENDESSNLFQLLELLHANECSDPRDRIYSLIGLLTPDGLALPVVDYTKHYSHVYAEFVALQKQKWSQQYNLFSNLTAFGSLWHFCPSLPSWVPAWNRRLGDSLHHLELNDVQEPLQTSFRCPVSLWTTCPYGVVVENWGLCTNPHSMSRLFDYFERSQVYPHKNGSRRLSSTCRDIATFFRYTHPSTINEDVIASFLVGYFRRFGMNKDEAVSLCIDSLATDRYYKVTDIQISKEKADTWLRQMRYTCVCFCDPLKPSSTLHSFAALAPASVLEGDLVSGIVTEYGEPQMPDMIIRSADEVHLPGESFVDFSCLGIPGNEPVPIGGVMKYRMIGSANVRSNDRHQSGALESLGTLFV